MAMIYGIKRGGKYRKYVKLRNQVKNMIRMAKAVMEKGFKDVKTTKSMLTPKGKQNLGYQS